MPKTSMTRDWVHKITTEKAQEDWYDEMETGLVLRVGKTGRKVWYLFYRDPITKANCRHRLGEYPILSLADARDQADELKVKIKRGANPVADRRAEKEAPTFKELAEEYIERHAKPNKRSWEGDAQTIGKYLLPAWQHRKAHDIKKRDVIALLDGIVDQGYPIAANRTFALIRKIYRWANSRDILEVNPCFGISAPAPEKQRDRVLTEDEIRKVWAAFDALALTADGKASPLGAMMGLMFKLRFVTAQRGGEVESMAWADVDLVGGWWTIPAERAKNGLSHRVPLTPPAIAILEEMKAKAKKGSPWVFTSPRLDHDEEGRPVITHISNVKKAVARVHDAIKKANDGHDVDFVMHDLRRTAASYMASMGIARLVISKILNHVESGVTAVYERHSYDAEKRQALDAWAERLAVILSN